MAFDEDVEELTTRIIALEGEVSRNTDSEDRGRVIAVLFDMLLECARAGEFGRARRYLANIRSAAFHSKKTGRARIS